LFQLDPGKAEKDAVLEPVTLPDETGEVHDGLAWTTGKLLLATDSGLRIFDQTTAKLSRGPFEPPQKKVRSLCRDGKGRLWLAGEGVGMLDRGGKLHTLESVPLIGGSIGQIGPLGADREQGSGVIVSLGRRGVLVLRADMK